MKTIILILFAAMLGTVARAEKTLVTVRFELQLGGESFACATYLQIRDDKAETYGPILVLPAGPEDLCVLGIEGGGFRVSASGSEVIPLPDEPWFIQFRDLRMEAKAGVLYLLRAEGNGFRLRSIPFPSVPFESRDALKARVLAALQ